MTPGSAPSLALGVTADNCLISLPLASCTDKTMMGSMCHPLGRTKSTDSPKGHNTHRAQSKRSTNSCCSCFLLLPWLAGHRPCALVQGIIIIFLTHPPAVVGVLYPIHREANGDLEGLSNLHQESHWLLNVSSLQGAPALCVQCSEWYW